MADHLLTLYATAATQVVLVVSPDAYEAVRHATAHDRRVTLAVQEEPTGMLDAVLLATDHVRRAAPRRVLITWCDQLAISPSTVDAVVRACAQQPEPDIVMPVCRGRDPYVHLERDATGRIVRVLHRREGDAMPPEGESDAGVFDLSCSAFIDWLPRYAETPDIGARTGERNFVPFVAWAAARGTVVTIPCSEPEEAIGINTPDDLRVLEAYLLQRHSR